MSDVPQTSETLLNDLARDSQHARWGEFVARYRPMMVGFLQSKFPTLEADDILQETLVALARALPDYHYAAGEHGAFHNYLTGILRHKALKALERKQRHTALLDAYAREPIAHDSDSKAFQSDWRKSLYEIALGQYLADESVALRTRQIFERVAIVGEKPEAVAQAFGLKRNAIDQIKSRGIASLKTRIRALLQVSEPSNGGGGTPERTLGGQKRGPRRG